jgi:hypothetical protein
MRYPDAASKQRGGEAEAVEELVLDVAEQQAAAARLRSTRINIRLLCFPCGDTGRLGLDKGGR